MFLNKRLGRYILALTLLVFAAVELPILLVGLTAQPEPGDVIIVLGARLMGREPSTMLRLRLEQAVNLYHENYAPEIIVSGARGKDEEISEAAAMRDYLVNRGIPAHRIHLEDGSYSTYQNLANSQAIMKQLGFRRAIIVSNASHIRRSLLLARQLEMEASAAPAPMANNAFLTLRQYLREGAAVLSLSVNGR